MRFCLFFLLGIHPDQDTPWQHKIANGVEELFFITKQKKKKRKKESFS